MKHGRSSGWKRETFLSSQVCKLTMPDKYFSRRAVKAPASCQRLEKDAATVLLLRMIQVLGLHGPDPLLRSQPKVSVCRT